MELIVPAIVILIIIGVMIVRLASQRKLLRDVEKYETLLREARTARWKYTQAVDDSRETLKEVQHVEANLQTIKAEIYGFRSEFREMLASLRREVHQSTNTILDRRTIAQMKSNFNQKWKFVESRKRFCLEVVASYRESQKKLHQRVTEEDEATALWNNKKEQVLFLYRSLSLKVKITDPIKYFT